MMPYLDRLKSACQPLPPLLSPPSVDNPAAAIIDLAAVVATNANQTLTPFLTTMMRMTGHHPFLLW
jgi:hypothetical protein